VNAIANSATVAKNNQPIFSRRVTGSASKASIILGKLVRAELGCALEEKFDSCDWRHSRTTMNASVHVTSKTKISSTTVTTYGMNLTCY